MNWSKNIIIPLSVAACSPQLTPLPSVAPFSSSKPASVGQPNITNVPKGGVFHLPATANGVPFDFVVDTGASITTFSREDAEKLGVNLTPSRYNNSIAATADGTKHILTPFKLARLEVSSCHLFNLQAVILDTPMPERLLGMNALVQMNLRMRYGKMSVDCD
jgi:aspartyl protease family protein